MEPTADQSAALRILGLECGGTRTVGILTDPAGVSPMRFEAGAANLRLLTDEELAAHFEGIQARLPSPPTALGIGMAGAREETDRRRIRLAAARIWPGLPCWAGNDLETALAAADLDAPATPVTRIIIISGTGSCCYGRNDQGRTAKVGGWGHLLGDQGSGYDIALQALRTVIQELDQTGTWPRLGAVFLQRLQLNEPNDLVTWLHGAGKTEVAALACEVFATAAAGDRLARGVLAGAAARLSADALACARRLARRGARVEFVFVGSVLLKQAGFARRVASGLRRGWPTATVRALAREGAWGAVARALQAYELDEGRPDAAPGRRLRPGRPATVARSSAAWIPEATALSPTERRNPRSWNLDRQSVASAIRLMLAEEAGVPAAVRRATGSIERAVRLIVRRLRGGGRLFYVGAGTSGRLGVLDASECPPTFRTPPEMVQGILAGGQEALWRSIEGAEDDADAGARAIEFRGVTAQDVVVGIAASGRTPFVWGALAAARARGTKTVFIGFNPHLRWERGRGADVVITVDVGPEVLTGSTRLKAGTATKLILNLLSTLAMVRLGKVISNLMVDVHPSNTKLRARAIRILRELTGTDEAGAVRALDASGWDVKAAYRAGRGRRRSLTNRP